MNKATIIVSLAVCGLASATCAIAGPPAFVRAYDAVYELTSPTGSSTMHQMSDGKGHLRSETDQGKQRIMTILDFPGKTAITIIDAQKMYMKMPMTSEQAASSDWNKTKRTSKEIGTKVINSHPCHGYESKEKGITSRVWVGDDIQNLVLSETTTPQGKTVMTLKSFSTKVPEKNLLEIPYDYKEMKTPGK